MSQKNVPNVTLQRARLGMRSPSGSGRPMSRQELADALIDYLYRAYRARASLDATYIGKLERGEHRWPNDRYREAFRQVLGAVDDTELGFYVVRYLQSPTTARDDAQLVHPDGAGLNGGALASHWLGMLAVFAASANDRGATAVLPLVSMQTRLIDAQRRDLPDGQQPKLLTVQARWYEFASWAAINSGQTAGADQWLAEAFTLADAAGDARLASYVLMRRAQQAAENHSPAEAVDLAIKARRQFGAASRRTQALAYVRQAHGHALLGESQAAQQAMRWAGAALNHAGQAESDDLDGHCSTLYVSAYEAYCQLLLGDHGQAVNMLTEVLDHWPVSMHQDEVMWRAWLAQANAGIGHLAEAGIEASRALRLAEAIGSTRASKVLRGLAAGFSGTAQPAEVRQFLRQLKTSTQRA